MRSSSPRPGNAVIISGRNRPKIDRIAQSVRAGLHVLADKPWILTSADLAPLEAVLAEADRSGVVYPSLAFDSLFENRGSLRYQSILDRVGAQIDAFRFTADLHGTDDAPVCDIDHAGRARIFQRGAVGT